MSCKVTVLIACYNSSQYLPDIIRALQVQTCACWEAVIVDDASVAGEAAVEVVARSGDPRVRVIRHDENRGAGAAFNTAFAASRTPYVMIHGGDDMLDGSFFEKTLSILENSPEVDAVFTDIQLFGSSSAIWRYSMQEMPTLIKRQWMPHTLILRRELWARTTGHYEGPELRHGNVDWDFMFSLAETGRVRFHHIPEPLYLYRQHGANMSSKRSYHEFITRECMYQRHKAYIDAHGGGKSFVADGYLEAAWASWQKEEYLRAAQLAGKAVELVPVVMPGLSLPKLSTTEAVRQLARLQVTLAEAGSQGLALVQEYVDMRLNIIGIYALLHKYGEARHHAEVLLGMFLAAKALEALPDLLVFYAMLCREEGDNAAVEEALELALSIEPGCRDAALLRARSALDSKRPQMALFIARQAMTHGKAETLPVLGMVAQELARSFSSEKLRASLEAPMPAFRACEESIDALIYASALGRKLFWAYRAKDLYDTYGHTEGGFDALLKAVEAVRPRRVLEIGCGNGRNLVLFSRMGIESVGQDISASALELAQARQLPHVTLNELPLGQLEYPDNHFDLIVSNRVLQHVTKEEAQDMLSNVARMGTALYLNELQAEDATQENYYQYKHDYEGMLAQYGLVLVEEIRGEGVCARLFQKISA